VIATIKAWIAGSFIHLSAALITIFLCLNYSRIHEAGLLNVYLINGGLTWAIAPVQAILAFVILGVILIFNKKEIFVAKAIVSMYVIMFAYDLFLNVYFLMWVGAI
jgi:hypothetical protein